MKKRISWEEIVSTYSDMWAFMSNVKRDQVSVVYCDLICVVPFEKMADKMAQLKEKVFPLKEKEQRRVCQQPG